MHSQETKKAWELTLQSFPVQHHHVDVTSGACDGVSKLEPATQRRPWCQRTTGGSVRSLESHSEILIRAARITVRALPAVIVILFRLQHTGASVRDLGLRRRPWVAIDRLDSLTAIVRISACRAAFAVPVFPDSPKLKSVARNSIGDHAGRNRSGESSSYRALTAGISAQSMLAWTCSPITPTSRTHC